MGGLGLRWVDVVGVENVVDGYAHVFVCDGADGVDIGGKYSRAIIRKECGKRASYDF